ncbi:hypothetical protein [Pedobacter sandarakinus]|uniref:hypothetical protein n=1 Tax=Pedobacter sandarakinus TaxID=353156 RepID=UPI00224779C8|nr:hypothetical protein [Pedobacter sandarakinus]MCX2576376.1 hypothetical protein [Pedobacter sandarakinus]
MKKIYLLVALTYSIMLAQAQSQIIDVNLSIGREEGLVTGAGFRLYFNSPVSNSDELSIYRYNRGDNTSDLRVNIGDEYGSGGDRL